MTGATTATTITQRAYSAHQPKWQRFQSNLIVPSTQVGGGGGGAKSSGGGGGSSDQQQQPFLYQRQYSHVYHQRLAVLGPRCWERMDQQVSDKQKLTKVNRVLELRDGVASLAVGTLVKETSSDSKGVTLHPDSLCQASDALYLEDESGRVSLEFVDTCDVSMHHLCTGVVVGVQGTVADGVLQVQAVYFPPPPPLAATPENSNNTTASTSTRTPHLLLLSGLDCAGDSGTSSLPRDMLLSFLQGRFGVEKAASVCQVVIAGGLLRTTKSVAEADKKSRASAAAALRDLDGFVWQIAATGIPVCVMPGQYDPTTANWPQRPLHKALLPRSSSSGSTNASSALVARTPNPYAGSHQIGGDDKNEQQVMVVGTDGANVRDLTQRLLLVSASDKTKDDDDDQKPSATPSAANDDDTKNNYTYTPVSELQALERTLEWNHLCPTGPDSVPTAPHAEQDPMVLQSWPRVYFAGNAQQFATKKVARADSNDDCCRLVCIPKFAETGEAVLVNLETLNAEILRFED